jgi:hypothetical protein
MNDDPDVHEALSELHTQRDRTTRDKMDAILKLYLRLPTDAVDDTQNQLLLSQAQCVHPSYLVALCYLFKKPPHDSGTDGFWPNRLTIHVLNAFRRDYRSNSRKFKPLSESARRGQLSELEPDQYERADELGEEKAHHTWALVLFRLAYQQMILHGYDPTIFQDRVFLALVESILNGILARGIDHPDGGYVLNTHGGRYLWKDFLFVQVFAAMFAVRTSPPYGGFPFETADAAAAFQRHTRVPGLLLELCKSTTTLRCSVKMDYLVRAWLLCALLLCALTWTWIVRA